MNKICHLCNKEASWIVQSANLAYWYCKDCKVEPIDLPILEEITYKLDERTKTTWDGTCSGSPMICPCPMCKIGLGPFNRQYIAYTISQSSFSSYELQLIEPHYSSLHVNGTVAYALYGTYEGSTLYFLGAIEL